MTSARIATYFIGGAADKSNFMFIVPKTNLIKSRLIGRYLTASVAGGQAETEINNTLEKLYWGYEEVDALFAEVQKSVKQFPALRIRLVGHSLGGWQAAKLTQRMQQIGIAIDLLITLDPVGVGYFLKIEGSETSTPNPVAKTWVNVIANHTLGYNQDDLVADAGVRWRPARDVTVKTKPTADFGVPNSHADVWEMVTFPGVSGRSAWQLLTN